MYTIKVKIEVISEENLTHVNRYYEHKVQLLSRALQISSDFYVFVVKILQFTEI